LQLRTYGTTRATIDSSGNLLVGGTTVATKVTLNKTGFLGSNTLGSATDSTFTVDVRGNLSTDIVAGEFLGGYLLDAYDSAAASGAGVSRFNGMHFVAGGNFGASASDVDLVFATGLNGNATERARITSGGVFLFNKTASGIAVGTEIDSGYARLVRAESTNSATTLDVYSTGAGAYRFFVGMGGTVYATNTSISAISDQRLKENIRDLDVGIDAVMALKPRKFDWKEGKGQDKKDVRGFIAQEFEQVFPDLVDEWKDPAPEGEEPYKSVRQDLIPVLVKAIQEQQAMIEDLKAKVAALEAN